MRILLKDLCAALADGRSLAMASVIRQQGSAPRGPGSRLLADERGLVTGTVGGGLAEARALEACAGVLRGEQACVLDISMDGTLAAQSDMICGGRVQILVELLVADAPTLEIFRELLTSLEGTGAVLVTPVRDPAGRFLLTGERRGAVAEGVRGLEAGGPWECAVLHTVEGEFLVSRFVPPYRLILAGGGHVSRPTAQIAALAGFEVEVLDDRAEFASRERFPWAAGVRVVPEFRDCFGEHAPDARTGIVILTRGHMHDGVVLEQALRTCAGYVGMIGSKRKRDELYAKLRAGGVGQELLDKVHCPVGLSIGAQTPEEIAVSIIAECIAFRRKAL